MDIGLSIAGVQSWGRPWFWCGIAQCRKTLSFILQRFFASIGAALIVGRGLGTGLWALDYNSTKFRDFRDLS